MEHSHSDSAALMRLGVMVAVGLAFFTVIEFLVATGHLAASFFLIVMIALAKIVLITLNYMHVGKIFKGEGAEE